MTHMKAGIVGLALLTLILASPLVVLGTAAPAQTQTQGQQTGGETGVEVLLRVLNESIVRVEALLTSWNVSSESEAWEYVAEARTVLENATALLEAGDVEGARMLASHGFKLLGEAISEAKPEKPRVERSVEIEISSEIDRLTRQIQVLIYAASKVAEINVTISVEITKVLKEANETLANATRLLRQGNYTEAEEAVEKAEQLIDRAKDMIEEAMEHRVREKAREVLEEAREKIEEAIRKLNETIKRLNETLGEEAAPIIERLNATIAQLLELKQNITSHAELAAMAKPKEIAHMIEKLIEEEDEWEEDVEAKSKSSHTMMAAYASLNGTIHEVRTLLNQTEDEDLKLRIMNIVNESSRLESLLVKITMELARGEGDTAITLAHNVTVKIELLHKDIEVAIDKLVQAGLDPEPLKKLKEKLDDIKDKMGDVKEDAKKIKKKMGHEEEHEEEAEEHEEKHGMQHGEEHRSHEEQKESQETVTTTTTTPHYEEEHEEEEEGG